MTLDQLRIFVAVAERQHMSRAAEALRLTQSAVSGAIRSLEARHNVSLFHRVGRRIELTQDGRFFLEQARTVLRAAQTAEFSLGELRGLKHGIITLYASQTTGAYWLPERLARFHAEYPNIEIRMSIGNTEEVASAVSDGRAEVGFVEGAISHPDLEMQQVDLDQLVIAVGRSHPWSRHTRIKVNQIAQSKWVLREKGSGTRAVFEQALAQAGISFAQLQISVELPSNEAVRAAVEAGMGATAISHAVVKSALLARDLRALQFRPLVRPFSLLKHRARAPSNAARAFIALIAKEKLARPTTIAAR